MKQETGIALAIQKPEISKDGEPNMGAEAEAMLKTGGISFRMRPRVDFAQTTTIPGLFVWYMKNDDLASAVGGGIAAMAIVGEDQLGEYAGNTAPVVLEKLGFSFCKLAIGVTTRSKFGEKANREYQEPKDLIGKTIATKYPRGTARWLDRNGIPWVAADDETNFAFTDAARIMQVKGGAESVVYWGAAEACVEIVVSKDSVDFNKILPVDDVLTSQAVLVVNPNLGNDKKYEATVLQTLRRIMMGLWQTKFTILEFNYPVAQEEKILDSLPARESPTKTALANPAWAAAKVLISTKEADEWSDTLLERGARDPFCTKPERVYPNLDDPEITRMMRVIY